MISPKNFLETAKKLIAHQFPEFSNLPIVEVDDQGHDNKTFRLGAEMLIRLPTAESYALAVEKEQKFLPQLVKHLDIPIPAPIKMGEPCDDFPYPFSIYKWLPGKSANQVELNNDQLEKLASQLAHFLKQLQGIQNLEGPGPGQHSWWRGDHVNFYDKGAREQIADLSGTIDNNSALKLWEMASATKWERTPVWIHGDLAAGNILVEDGQLSGVIDFGGMAYGDPACDLVIAWTFLFGKSRDIFIREMNLDDDTWIRARAWALWKATFELCQIEDKNSDDALIKRKIIDDVLVDG